MTDAFILERAKVLCTANGEAWDDIHTDKIDWRQSVGKINGRYRDVNALMRIDYIFMAQAVADHDKKRGRKVMERDYPGRSEAMWNAAWDAAPAWPGEGK